MLPNACCNSYPEDLIFFLTKKKETLCIVASLKQGEFAKSRNNEAHSISTWFVQS